MKNVFLILFMFLLVHKALPQSGNYVAGQIVTINGETLNVYIKDIDYSYEGNSKIRYYRESFDNKEKIARKDVSRIHIKGKTYRNISIYLYSFNSEDDVSGIDSDGYEKITQLMELKVEGLISLYSSVYTYASPDGTNRGTITNYYIAKETEIYEQVESNGFKSYIKKYIGDCDGLYEKVLDKTFRYSNIEELINKYNTECPNK